MKNDPLQSSEAQDFLKESKVQQNPVTPPTPEAPQSRSTTNSWDSFGESDYDRKHLVKLSLKTAEQLKAASIETGVPVSTIIREAAEAASEKLVKKHELKPFRSVSRATSKSRW